MSWRGLAMVGLLALLAPRVAEACPPGRPCNKYRRQVRTVHDKPSFYFREVNSALPRFDRKVIVRFLTISRWLPSFGESPFELPDKPSAGPGRVTINHVRDTAMLRFIDPTRAVPAEKPGERNVLIRQIERDATGSIYIDIDGEAYQLWRCVEHKPTVCLSSTGTSIEELLRPRDPASGPPSPSPPPPEPAAPVP